jgi:hypothetical protein
MAFQSSDYYSVRPAVTVMLLDLERLFFSHLTPSEIEENVLKRRLLQIEAQKHDEQIKEYDSEAYAKRMSRRALEKSLGHFIPIGPWDLDLDERHDENRHSINLPEDLKAQGYSAYAVRHLDTWTWCGYVTVPNGHPMRIINNDNYQEFFCDPNFKVRPSGFPIVPQEVTYARDGTLGWDHGHSYDTCPRPRNAYMPNTKDSSLFPYVDFDDITNECIEFARYLQNTANFPLSPSIFSSTDTTNEETTTSDDEGWTTVTSKKRSGKL